MGKGALKTPDAGQTAASQSRINRQTAKDNLRLNSIDRHGVFGSTTFDKDASGLPTAISTNLSPEMGGLLSNYTGIAQGLSGGGADGGTNPLSTQYDPFGAETQGYSQQFFDRGQALLQPGFDQAQNNLDVRLTERGLPIGSEARNIAEGNLQREQGLAMSDLAANAALQGPQIAAMTRNQQFGDLNNIMGLVGGIPQPDGVAQPQANIAAPDYAGMTWNNYAAERQNYADQMGGLGSLLGTGAKLMTGGFF